ELGSRERLRARLPVAAADARGRARLRRGLKRAVLVPARFFRSRPSCRSGTGGVRRARRAPGRQTAGLFCNMAGSPAQGFATNPAQEWTADDTKHPSSRHPAARVLTAVTS